ncbi:hypothetical protein SAMN05421659_103332 [[Clostridium] fimetarium]|uniref:Uncharacterized protein n=1 Tax=[Clostridium] fimetarium TaxID=99656 RepID=A0A1I0NSG0_9FIRM|nr:hypothetical protein SAMN05421659_103332 [[Clostridium] fimetarium]
MIEFIMNFGKTFPMKGFESKDYIHLTLVKDNT